MAIESCNMSMLLHPTINHGLKRKIDLNGQSYSIWPQVISASQGFAIKSASFFMLNFIVHI